MKRSTFALEKKLDMVPQFFTYNIPEQLHISVWIATLHAPAQSANAFRS
ncbi:MAG: hypothetical protein AB7S81_04905 [Bdellovibrionales bacterium]